MNKAEWEPNYQTRKKIIGVMGDSKASHPELAAPLGELIAGEGHHLLTGAGGGVMQEVSKSFSNTQNRQGLVLGIVRANPNRVREDAVAQLRDYAPSLAKLNEWIEVPIYTHLRKSDESWDSRNHINVLTADVVVVLPGGEGTESEVELALEYHVPTILFLGNGTIHDHTADYFTKKYPNSPIKIAASPDEVGTAIGTFLS